MLKSINKSIISYFNCQNCLSTAKISSGLNSSSSSTSVSTAINKLKKNISTLDNLNIESVFSYRQSEVDNKITAYKQELSKLNKLKQVVEKRELKEKQERQAREEQKRLARQKAQQERERKRKLIVQKDYQLVKDFLNGVKRDIANSPYNKEYFINRVTLFLSHDHPEKKILIKELPAFFSQIKNQQRLDYIANALGSNYVYIYCVDKVTYSLGSDLFRILNKNCQSFIPPYKENSRIFWGL